MAAKYRIGTTWSADQKYHCSKCNKDVVNGIVIYSMEGITERRTFCEQCVIQVIVRSGLPQMTF